MNCIIAGGRNINNYQHVLDAVKASGFNIDTVISGGATGIDTLAIRWAKENSKNFKTFEAEWDKLGKAAGPVRNKAMAKYSNELIAIWDGKSRGTGNMIEQAIDHNLKIYIHRIDQNWWISSHKMTIGVTTVDNIIIDAAPIVKKFIGQHLVKLLKWMQKQGDIKIEKLDKTNQESIKRV